MVTITVTVLQTGGERPVRHRTATGYHVLIITEEQQAPTMQELQPATATAGVHQQTLRQQVHHAGLVQVRAQL